MTKRNVLSLSIHTYTLGTPLYTYVIRIIACVILLILVQLLKIDKRLLWCIFMRLQATS